MYVDCSFVHLNLFGFTLVVFPCCHWSKGGSMNCQKYSSCTMGVGQEITLHYKIVWFEVQLIISLQKCERYLPTDISHSTWCLRNFLSTLFFPKQKGIQSFNIFRIYCNCPLFNISRIKAIVLQLSKMQYDSCWRETFGTASIDESLFFLI